MAILLSSAGLTWLWIAIFFLFAGALVSAVRKMLRGFSRKNVLEASPPGARPRIEVLLSRIDAYEQCLRVVEHLVRILIVASLAFATVFRVSGPSGLGVEFAFFAAFVAGTMLVTIVFLYLGSSILARLRPDGAIRILLPALDRMASALAPVESAYARLVRWGARAVGADEERPSADVVEEQILSAVEEGEREGILQRDETSMIESIVRFRDRQVSEVMTPRTEMICIDAEDDLEESVRVAIECGHSRIPVYQESKDNIIGILYVKDLLKYWNKREVRLADVVRQAHFIPESKKIGALFREFRSQRFHIAIILDEFGGTSGLITIEDIIEEIVGEIADEFEKVEPRAEFQRVSADVVEFDARLPVRELNERLDLALPQGDGYDTVGGFLFSAMGRVPAVGEGFELGPARLEVVEADERRINRLRVRITRPASADGMNRE